MTQLLWSIGGFVAVVGLLVTVHEFGHFWVARRCGVRVLRFSVGFGRPLLRWSGRDGTEYVVGALPLGGYVRMLDEGDGPVPAEAVGSAFNRQPVGRRALIAAAGPAANLLFAVLVYWLMYMVGVWGLRPELGPVPPDSPAARAGFAAGDLLQEVDGRAVPTWEEASLRLLDAVLAGRAATVTVTRAGAAQPQVLSLDPGREAARAPGNPLPSLGLTPALPVAPAVIGRVEEDSAAARAGLRPGDRVVAVDGRPVERWEQWASAVRESPGRWLEVAAVRDGQRTVLQVRPEAVPGDEGGLIGRVGTALDPPPADPESRVLRRYGPLAAGGQALHKTWEVGALTVHMLYRMVRGEASVQNLSGPITIAQFAGESVRFGLAPFLAFMALVSVSLAVLNLLPVPVLDGGHLVYYAIEWVRGAPPPERVRLVAQQGGVALLIGFTLLALYNDISRLLS